MITRGITTIQLEKETRQLLLKVGRKEQTYDALIRELVVKPDTCKRCGDIIKENLSGSEFENLAPRQGFRYDERNKSTGAHD
jgi:hypothetical protein